MKNNLTSSMTKHFLPEGNTQMNIYQFDRAKESATMLNQTRNRDQLIRHFFSPIKSLAGKPVYTLTTNSMVVTVFYYIPARNQVLNNNTVNNLGEALSLLFKRPVELRLIKLQYPYLNRSILAQYIAMNTQDYTLVQIVRQVISSISPVKNLALQARNVLNSSLPSQIVGIKIRVSGRLMMERSRPRYTVQMAERGSFAKDKLAIVDYSSFTSKNKKGIFTVKVWISQRVVV